MRLGGERMKESVHLAQSEGNQLFWKLGYHSLTLNLVISNGNEGQKCPKLHTDYKEN